MIPAYNVASYVAWSIRSVLAQTFTDLELIVVDDGSGDGTMDVVSVFGDRIRLLTQPNAGVAAARDRGAAEARGDILAFLDADDEWSPRKLEVQIGWMDRHPEAVACFVGSFGIEETSGRRREILYRLEDDMVRALAYGPIIGNASSVAMPRAIFERVGGFDTALSQSADWDMWLRLAQQGPIGYVDEPLVRIRLGRPRSLTSDVARLERDTIRILEKFFASPVGIGLGEGSRVRSSHYLTLAGSYLGTGEVRRALRWLITAILAHPPAIGTVAGALARRIRGRSTSGGPIGSRYPNRPR